MTGGRILITGATGLVGSRLAERLAAYDLTLAVRRTVPDFTGRSGPGSIRIVETGDIETSTALDAALEGVDRVVHLAAHAHVVASERSAGAAAMHANAKATERLAKAAASAGVAIFVHLSSVAAIAANATGETIGDATPPRPTTAYGRAKLLAEAHVEELAREGTLAVSLRPPLIVGAKARGNLALLVRAAASGLPLPLAGLRNRRSLVALDTLCEAIASLLHGGFPPRLSGAYALADPDPLSLAQIVGELRAGMGREPGLFALPGSFFAAAGILTGRKQQIRALTGDLVVDGSRFDERFGFSPPVGAREALRTVGAEHARRSIASRAHRP